MKWKYNNNIQKKTDNDAKKQILEFWFFPVPFSICSDGKFVGDRRLIGFQIQSNQSDNHKTPIIRQLKLHSIKNQFQGQTQIPNPQDYYQNKTLTLLALS